jgi:hypothetical protein
MVDINLLTVRALTLMLLGEQTQTRTRTLKAYFTLEMRPSLQAHDSMSIVHTGEDFNIGEQRPENFKFHI